MNGLPGSSLNFKIEKEENLILEDFANNPHDYILEDNKSNRNIVKIESGKIDSFKVSL